MLVRLLGLPLITKCGKAYNACSYGILFVVISFPLVIYIACSIPASEIQSTKTFLSNFLQICQTILPTKFLPYDSYISICNSYYTYLSNTFTDLPTATNIRNTSQICVTYFNISWDAPNSITCGDVYYEVSISPPPIEGDAVVTTVDRFLSVTGLNNSLPDVTITVTAINRAGRGDGRMLPVQLPKLLGT